MADFQVKPLTEETWQSFADLVERHNGVWGGCWCMGFHPKRPKEDCIARDNQVAKKCRVQEGTTHSALVFDGDLCIGWCQYGSPDELPRIKSRKAYEEGLNSLPDWRIVCFFVDKSYRRKGVAAVALQGAVEQIAKLGGGTVESYPEDTTDRKTSAAFIHNGTLAMFEKQGFKKDRKIAMHRWVVVRSVNPTQP